MLIACEKEKRKWVRTYSSRVKHLFEQWQGPLEIDSRAFDKYLERELAKSFDDPLRKNFAELI